MTNKGKPTIWVVEGISPLHEERKKILDNCGFEIYFASDTASFQDITSKVRPTTILVDTFKDFEKTSQFLQHISSKAELATCRASLIDIHNDAPAKKLALATNFRDIIPWSLPNQEWVTRLQFATASKPIEIPSTLCGIYINQPAVVVVPARVVWVNETHMRIECRGSQKVGNTLQIAGEIAKSWGVSHISLTVESIHKNKLIYRFSQAIVARWSIPAANMNRAITAIHTIKNIDSSPKVRMFLALSRPDWRKIAIDAITPERHELNVAMTRSNISSEFKFFSPDVVFFDDKVLSSFSNEELLELFAKVPTDVPLIVFGNFFDEPKIKSLLLGRPLFIEEKPTSSLFVNALSRYKLIQHLHDSIIASQVSQIESNHPWSVAELEITSRLTQINPKNGILSLPFSIGPFALARLDSPLFKKSLQRDIYIKITNLSDAEFGHKNPKFSQSAEFIVSDVQFEERKRLAHTLLSTISDYYAKTFGAFKNLIPLAPSADSYVPEIQSLPVERSTLASASDNSAIPGLDELRSLEAALPLKKHTPSLVVSKEPRVLRKRPSIQYDPVVAKALGVFAIAILVMVLIIYAATHVSEDSYKDHGKEYSEFFKRMKDPDYRKTNPAQPEKTHSP